jgi:hypothetical protein
MPDTCIPVATIEQLATELELAYYETSALTHDGVKTCFDNGVSGFRVARSLVFCVMLFDILSFFFWPLNCLSFFGLWFINLKQILKSITSDFMLLFTRKKNESLNLTFVMCLFFPYEIRKGFDG